MIRAVIDMGTNTFNLLIGQIKDDKLEVLFKKKHPVLLGMGGINEGVLCPEAIVRAKDALIDFKSECEKFRSESIIGIGTSAMRSVSNAQEIVTFAEEIGIPIEIISGKEEAELIYQGVRWLVHPKDNGIIMDIGGGSTEFIVFQNDELIHSESLDIGVSRIYQQLGKPTDFTQEHFEWMAKFFENSKPQFFTSTVRNLYGASGSFETLYEVIEKKRYNEQAKLQEMNLADVHKAIQWVLNSTYEQRLKSEWIANYRKEMIPIAAFKIKWALDNLNIENVYISPFSLKEGAMNLKKTN